MKIKILTATIALVASGGVALADEGMWIPISIDANMPAMQQLGCQLSAKDIYNADGNSIKDAVVIFGGGCTGAIVSDEGLLLTNHHCGYSAIQKHSSAEHDYLTNGFWAQTRDDELPNDGLTVSLLVRMADVTDSVTMNSDIEANIAAIESAAECNGRYEAEVKPIYGGNRYLLCVYEVFRDIRLVGAPPSSIGKFGGDTDNWVWPRHTGDFSIFRIYADRNNRPADYSADNVPYKPRKYLKISVDGVREGDFTMVVGNPGSTRLYATSDYVQMIRDKVNPKLIELREAKLEVMNKHQKADNNVRIQYAAKNASTANAWKKWIGEIEGLQRMQTVENKAVQERQLAENDTAAARLLAEYKKIYGAAENESADFALRTVAKGLMLELFYRGGIETCNVADIFRRLMDGKIDAAEASAQMKIFYQNYNASLDKEMTAAVLKTYCKYAPKALIPIEISAGNAAIEKFVDDLFKSSIFDDEEATLKILSKWTDKKSGKIKNDAAYKFYNRLRDIYYTKLPQFFSGCASDKKIEQLDKQYIAAVINSAGDKPMPADANFTMRVAYGQVSGYKAADAVNYRHFTQLGGVIEKSQPDAPDYMIPNKLAQLHADRDFGSYADADGTLHTCFVATNHTTGGNSGSPVLNARGEIVGLNFDRAWDGVMSDYAFDPSRSRNISLDIRYLLFIVDKFAGASHLIKEMDLVKSAE